MTHGILCQCQWKLTSEGVTDWLRYRPVCKWANLGMHEHFQLSACQHLTFFDGSAGDWYTMCHLPAEIVCKKLSAKHNTHGRCQQDCSTCRWKYFTKHGYLTSTGRHAHLAHHTTPSDSQTSPELSLSHSTLQPSSQTNIISPTSQASDTHPFRLRMSFFFQICVHAQSQRQMTRKKWRTDRSAIGLKCTWRVSS
jgi:hypothetical protein